LRLQIGSPEHEFMKPVFYARGGIRILAVHIGKFYSDFAKFEAFEM
jgi:hypothetical protein